MQVLHKPKSKQVDSGIMSLWRFFLASKQVVNMIKHIF
jgi:hypothetical protein